MGILRGFSGHPAIGSANGPFDVVAEDKDGMVIKTTMPMLKDVVTITATDAITDAEHGGRINLLAEPGGDAAVTLTLPSATGSGMILRFVVTVVNTSNYVIAVPDASHTLEGVIIGAADGGDTVNGWETAADSDTITLNGTTTGGAAIGDYLEFWDIGTNLWHVHGTITQTGTEATPFSAAVS